MKQSKKRTRDDNNSGDIAAINRPRTVYKFLLGEQNELSLTNGKPGSSLEELAEKNLTSCLDDMGNYQPEVAGGGRPLTIDLTNSEMQGASTTFPDRKEDQSSPSMDPVSAFAAAAKETVSLQIDREVSATEKKEQNNPSQPTNNILQSDRERQVSTLPFQTGRLYGRGKHIEMIMEAYRKLVKPDILPGMVLIPGHSGAGKSALVQHMQKPIRDMGGNFVCGKFDHFRQMELLSAIINAFTQFCTKAATTDTKNIHQMRSNIQDKVGSAVAFLANIIPTLRKIVQIPTIDNVSMGSMEAQHMLKHTLQLFVRAIATPDHPLVLFLDDLQWADPSSLDLIETLVADSENKSLLFIGAYRDNEVDATHPLAAKLHRIVTRQIHITEVGVGNLSKEHANEMISDMIQTPPHLTHSLTDAVYLKTNGNVFFILKFLGSICDEGFLFFSSQTQQWQWDIAMIESKKPAENTIELMTRKILQLPKETQSALKLVACLGYCCEDFVLSSMAAGDGIGNFGCTSLITSLDLAVNNGLLDRSGSNYRFAHDQIQIVAYSLIPEDERGNMHLWIGSQVLANKDASPDKALFLAVGQLNKVALVMKDTAQRIHLAGLNLQAAQKSRSLACFVPAAFYLNRGIQLLEKESWKDHYDLCLQLYSLCAEAEYCTGDFDEMNNKLDEVFSKAKCLDDQLDSYVTLINALNARNLMKNASEVGFNVLSQLGESFQTSPDMKSLVKVEFAKTKKMMKGKTDDDILKLKPMDNTHKIAAMRIMYIMALTSFQAGNLMRSLLILRMVQISLNHGICGESAYGFACFGALSCRFKDMSGGYRFGQLSLRLLGGSKTNKCFTGVYNAVYIFIHPRFKHYRKSLAPLEYAYREGMRCGDVSFAMTCIRQYCVHAFYCGEELSKLEKIFGKYDKVMKEHKQEIYQDRNLPYWQAVLNLIGQSKDPKQLIGGVMNQKQLQSLESKCTRAAAAIYHIRSWLAYIFGSYELASKMMDKRRAIPPILSPVLSCSFLFVDSLISFEMSHRVGGSKWNALAQKCIEEMKGYAQDGPLNCQHKLQLLQAESAFLLGECGTAAQTYNDAIDTAGKNGFVQDQALAYERAGVFHSKQGNVLMASLYYSQAHSAYLKWGAKCKADHLRLQYGL